MMCMGKLGDCGAYYKVYETNHPGAIIEVLGRRNAGAPWISIWSGAVSPPAGTNQRVNGVVGSTARAWVIPGVAAPRSERLQHFRLVLDSAAVLEHNEIDAVGPGSCCSPRHRHAF